VCWVRYRRGNCIITQSNKREEIFVEEYHHGCLEIAESIIHFIDLKKHDKYEPKENISGKKIKGCVGNKDLHNPMFFLINSVVVNSFPKTTSRTRFSLASPLQSSDLLATFLMKNMIAD
jgi:hypothetical protein